MGGGSSGGSDINQIPGGFRSWQKEQKDIGKGYGFQFGQFDQFGQNNPLLNAANTGALGFFNQMFGPNAGLGAATSRDIGLINAGGYTPESGRAASQGFRTIASAQGTAHDTSALGGEYAAREDVRNQNLDRAYGHLGSTQGLQTGALNQLLGTLGGGVSAYGGLTNPILGYLGNLFGGNQQSAIAQSQINAQKDASSSAKTGSSIGGALSAVGSIAGIAL